MDRKQELRATLPALREILLREWDPIGVRDEPAARGEYDQDALALFGMIANGATDAELEAYLATTEQEIGLREPVQSHATIVRSLRSLGIRAQRSP
jgi:hypothetical protein